MRILFAGTPATAATVLEGLLIAGHEVVAVLSREDAPLGRKRLLTPSPVAELALRRNLPVIKSNKLTSEVLLEISEHQVDLAIVVAYGVILRADALAALPVGWFNLHFSMLPRWRGAAPVQRALQNGDTETGVTLFKIDAGLDSGPILSAVPTTIHPDEDAGELLSRLALLGVSLVNAELPKLYSGTHLLLVQKGEITIAPKTSRDEARIDFHKDSKQVSDLVRAMNPEPMAWCHFQGEPMRILRARPLGIMKMDDKVGCVSVVGEKVIVTCGQGTALELLDVQPASRNAMQARDWLNGQSHPVVLN